MKKTLNKIAPAVFILSIVCGLVFTLIATLMGDFLTPVGREAIGWIGVISLIGILLSGLAIIRQHDTFI